MVQCPLCGYQYDDQAIACHTACPANRNCTMLCCPQCGYQVVDQSRSRIAGWRNRWRNRWRQQGQTPPGLDVRPVSANMRSLTQLAPGETAEVAMIATQNPGRLDRLSALGVVPGSQVTLHQRQPAFVFSVGETELSVDASIAAEIWTRPPSHE